MTSDLIICLNGTFYIKERKILIRITACKTLSELVTNRCDISRTENNVVLIVILTYMFYCLQSFSIVAMQHNITKAINILSRSVW